MKHRIIGPLHPSGHYAAGYIRPGRPGQFLVLVADCLTQEAARAAADRLDAEAFRREQDAKERHQDRMRGMLPATAWPRN